MRLSKHAPLVSFHRHHYHHQLNVHFLPRSIKGIDSCFPTALGRQSTFSNILGPLVYISHSSEASISRKSRLVTILKAAVYPWIWNYIKILLWTVIPCLFLDFNAINEYYGLTNSPMLTLATVYIDIDEVMNPIQISVVIKYSSLEYKLMSDMKNISVVSCTIGLSDELLFYIKQNEVMFNRW